MPAKDAPQSSPPPAKAAPAKKAAAKPKDTEERTVHRAGGWIDRGDGRGWVIEE